MPVHIGCKYTGQYAGHHDLATGDYWESLPLIDGDAAKMQRCLLERQPAQPVSQKPSLLDRIIAATKRDPLPTLA